MKIIPRDQVPPEERAEYDALLAELGGAVERNPLEEYNNPYLGKVHEKQLVFNRLKLPVKAAVGGNRSGKTKSSVADDVIQAVPDEFVPAHLKDCKKWQPPFHCRIIVPDFRRTMAVVLDTLRQTTPKAALFKGSWEKAWDKQNMVLRFDCESTIDLMTSEQDIDKFGGSAKHRIHYDEEPPGEKGQQIRRESQMRLIDYDGDEVFSLTPLLGLSWVFDEVWQPVSDKLVEDDLFSDGEIGVIRIDMDDNPYLSEKAKRRILKDLTPEEKAARKEGRFVHFEGLVYAGALEHGQLSPAHIIDDPQPKDQTIYVGIDPGYRTTAVLFAYFDHDNVMCVFDELYLHEDDAIPENAAEHIRRTAAHWGVTPDIYYMDPAGRITEQVKGENVQNGYMRAGIYCIPADNAVEAGVLEVKRRLFGKSLYVSRKCQKLLWEFSRYRLKPKEDGSFGVVKKDDHCVDTLRYLCQARPWHTELEPEPKEERWRPGHAPPQEWFDGQGVEPSPPLGAMT